MIIIVRLSVSNLERICSLGLRGESHHLEIVERESFFSSSEVEVQGGTHPSNIYPCIHPFKKEVFKPRANTINEETRSLLVLEGEISSHLDCLRPPRLGVF